MSPTISPYRNLSTSPCAPRPNVSSPAPPGAEDPDPAPPIDLSTIDSPAKAMLMPSMNATAWFVMLTTMANLGPIASTLQMTLGDNTQANLDFRPVPGDPGTMKLEVRGNLGNAAVKENWVFNPEGASFTIDGSIGNSKESLSVSGEDDGNHLDGTVGNQEVHQVIDFEGEGDDSRLVFKGTVGDRNVLQSIKIVNDADGSQRYILDGSLGNTSDGSTTPITTDITVTPTGHRGLLLTGQGNIAGTPLTSYTQTIKPSMLQPPTP